MKDIKFKIDSRIIEGLKKKHEIKGLKFTRDLLIKGVKGKDIIIVLIDLSPNAEDHSCNFYLEQKADRDFMFYVHESKVKMRQFSYKFMITPLAIPPLHDYDARIFTDEEDQYRFELTTICPEKPRDEFNNLNNYVDFKFTFPIRKLTKDTVQK